MNLSRLEYSGWSPGRLALGCEQLGGTDWGAVDARLLRRAVRRAVDLGVTVFDTADVYGLGRSEEELSRALGSLRNEAFIITKFGVRWWKDSTGGRAKTARDTSPAYLRTALEESLRRLKIEAIPLYLVHWPDESTPVEASLAALERFREDGKILNYGLSNFSAEAIGVAAAGSSVAAIEGPYNLLDRVGREAVFSLADRLGIARFAYGTLAQGVLTGKYTPQSKFGPDDRRSRLPQFTSAQWGRNQKILRALEKISRREQKTVAETAIRWVLDSGYVDTAIVGVKRPSHIESNVGALDWQLSPDDLQILNEISRAP